jgi:hypothetical protein
VPGLQAAHDRQVHVVAGTDVIAVNDYVRLERDVVDLNRPDVNGSLEYANLMGRLPGRVDGRGVNATWTPVHTRCPFQPAP